MERIRHNEVVLTSEEQVARRLFDELLALGRNITDAVIITHSAFPNLDNDFYEYLGQ